MKDTRSILTHEFTPEEVHARQKEEEDAAEGRSVDEEKMVKMLKTQLEAAGVDIHARFSEKENKNIQDLKKQELIRNAKDISDGYHTFGELYEFRFWLTIGLLKKICWRVDARAYIANETNDKPTPIKIVWRSKLHSDGTMFDGMFVLGHDKEPGKQITFHYHLDKWDDCDFAETLEKAPEWDGHTPADVLERLKAL